MERWKVRREKGGKEGRGRGRTAIARDKTPSVGAAEETARSGEKV